MKRPSKHRRSSQFRMIVSSVALLVVLLSLSGCMYPKDQLKQNQIAPKEAVRNVQAAIDQYKEETGMLPIKNSTVETPVYEKFIIDFEKLQRTGYISDIPSAAFEKGGNYYFLVIDEDTKPRVKLMNILSYQQLNDIQSWVTTSFQSSGKVPKGELMYPGFYQIDYNSLNKKVPVVQSVFSGQTIQALVDENGIVYSDYGIDIMQTVKKSGETSFDPKFDLRKLLVDGSDFVPVKAPAYEWVNNEPRAIQQ